MQGAGEAFTLTCGGRERFSYLIEDGQMLILNDKYQHGCEAAKIILMDSLAMPR